MSDRVTALSRETPLNCPFCGGEAGAYQSIGGTVRVYCPNPQCAAHGLQRATVADWNHRAAPPTAPPSPDYSKLGDITRAGPNIEYGVRHCRGHWHVTSGGEDIRFAETPGDLKKQYADVSEALDVADRLNRASPAAPLAQPATQPTMEQLRALRDANLVPVAIREELEREVALLDARNVGFPTLEDSDVPSMHTNFAHDVVDALFEIIALKTGAGHIGLAGAAGRSPAPAITDAQCLAAMRECAAQKGESHDAMWSQMDAQIRAEVLGEWRAILECAEVSGRSPAEVPPTWKASEEVSAAREAFDKAEDEYVQARQYNEDEEFVIQATAIEATAKLEELLDAVWRSAQQ